MAKAPLSYGDFIPLSLSGKRDTKRRYISPSSGEVISLRQFQKGARGGKTYGQFRKEREAKGIKPKPKRRQKAIDPVLELYVEKINRDSAGSGLPPLDYEEARKQADYKQIKKWLKLKSNKPTGRKAQALILLGLREPWWAFDVGATPPK